MDSVVRGIREYVNSFARRKGWNDPDEMIAEALYAYVQATEKLKRIQVDNLDAYIQSWITGACKQMLHKAKRHAHVVLTEDAAIYVMDHSRELLDELKLNPLEEQVVRYRLRGFDDVEIGEILGFSKQYIGKVKQQLVARLT